MSVSVLQKMNSACIGNKKSETLILPKKITHFELDFLFK